MIECGQFISAVAYSRDRAPDTHWIQRLVTDIPDGSHLFGNRETLIMQPDWANLQQFVFTSNLVTGKWWNSASFKAYQKWKHQREVETLISKWAGLNQ